ncbi:MAG TPA: ABC transporter permease [Corynebacteriales bacterium]|nr:ABC transporter permease [Mycobacteriales bacterium]
MQENGANLKVDRADGSRLTQASVGARLRAIPGRLGDYWIVGILALMIVFFSIVAPGFLTLRSWISTSLYAVQFILLAMGETFVIITGGVDLSVGSTMGLSGMVSGYLMRQLMLAGCSDAVTIAVGLVMALTTGLLVGLANGYTVAHLNILPMIATLGTLSIGRGLAFIVSDVSIAKIPDALGDFGNGILFGFMPVLVLVTIVITLVLYFILHKTRFGRHVYALGSNREAARRAGLSIEAYLIKVYMLSGLLAAIAGFFTLSRFTAASPLAGNQLELNAIASAIIGGASLFGGRGTIVGSVAGALIVSILVTAFVLLNIEPYWQMVATGLVLVAAVYVDQQRYRKVRLGDR